MDLMYATVALGAIVAGFVQGLSGFAFSLVAMSFWAWTLEPRLAAVLAVFGSLIGQVIAAVLVRRAVNLRLLLPFILGGCVGVPLGVCLLPQIDVVKFKLVLGVVLVLWCPAMLASPTWPPFTRGGRVADAFIGMLGGVTGGLGGFTGALPTLWCSLKKMPKDEQRNVIQNFNLSMLAVTMGMYVANGVVTRDMLPFCAIVAPTMLVPTWLGTRLYIGISELRFRQIVLGLLTVSGVAMLVSAVPRLV